MPKTAAQQAFDSLAPEFLDSATVKAIEDGLESEQQGRFLTLDQAVQFAKRRREAWSAFPGTDA